jgi:hypothetical protein
MTRIAAYDEGMRPQLEAFMDQTIADGNDTLKWNRINPLAFEGKIWCSFEGDLMVSMMALEDDRYTMTPNSGRVCRYHILKSHRHGRYGFMMLDHLYAHARDNANDLIYWTHDINNKPLNALYQHKKKFADGGDNSYYDREPFTLLTLDTRWLFKVSETSTLLQYVYYIKFREFEWIPKKCVLWREHDGDI